MHKNQEQVIHARALRADIVAAPEVWLPRRDVLMTWLDGFLVRAAKPDFRLGVTEADDLQALEKYLRKQKVPAV